MLSRSLVVSVLFVLCVYMAGHVFWGGSPQARRSYYYVSPDPRGSLQLLAEDIVIEGKGVDLGVVVEELDKITGQLDDLAVEVMDVHLNQVMLESTNEIK